MVAGRSPIDRLSFLVRQARTEVEPAMVDAGLTVAYAPFEGRNQAMPQSAPVAIAVWERRQQPGSVDPGSAGEAWFRQCAVLSIDQSAAALEIDPVTCPRAIPDKPPAEVPVLQARRSGLPALPPVLDVHAPTRGQVARGRAHSVASFGIVVRGVGQATGQRACLATDLALVLEQVNGIGNTDDAVIRAVNLSNSPCRVPPLTAIGDPDASQQWGVSGSEASPALRPLESAATPLFWRPGPYPTQAQSLTARLGRDEVPLRLGQPLGSAPLTAPADAILSAAPWTVSGYAAEHDDGPLEVAIAAPCRADQLAVFTDTDMGASGTPEPPTTWAVGLNISTATCRIGPRPSADRPGAPEIDGIPAVTAVRTVIVTPSSSVVLAQLTWARPGQLLVGGDWIDVEGK